MDPLDVMWGKKAELLYEIQENTVSGTDDRVNHSDESNLIAERFIKRL